MARMLEQKRIVQLIHDCPDDLRHFSRGVTARGVVNHFLTKKLFFRDRSEQELESLSQPEIERRERAIEALIQSCEKDQDNFIRKSVIIHKVPDFSSLYETGSSSALRYIDEESDDGYYVTSRGADLITIFGFCTIWIEKHKTWQIILSSSMVSAFAGAFFAYAMGFLRVP